MRQYQSKKNRFFESLRISLPKGPIREKVAYMREQTDFQLAYMAGAFNTAKTKTGVSASILHALQYPGAKCGLARATLIDVKGTTMEDLVSMGGGILHATDKNQGHYELIQAVPDPIQPNTEVTSTFRAYGLDKVYEDWMSSLEISHLMIDESDTAQRKRRHQMMTRVRKKVFHSTFIVKDYVEEMAVRWGVPFELAQEVLYQCKNTNYHELDLDHPMPGLKQIFICFNPKGPNEMWGEMMEGIPYPANGEFTQDYVAQHFGVVERHIPADEIMADRNRTGWKFGAGSVCIDEHGDRYFVRTEDDNNVIHTLAKMHFNPDGSYETELHHKEIRPEFANLAAQKITMFVFPWENESRDKDIATVSHFIDKEIKDIYVGGKFTKEMERVFPNFIDAPASKGGHILPHMSDDHVYEISRQGIGGLDDGRAHPMVALFGMLTRDSNTLIWFKEFDTTLRYSHENAPMIAGKIPRGKDGILPMTWGFDPHMDVKRTDIGADDNTAYHQYLRHLPSMIPGKPGEEGFSKAAELMQRTVIEESGDFPFRMYVTDACPKLIECLSTITWEQIKHDRNNPMVDFADSLKYGTSIYDYVAFAQTNIPVHQVRTRRVGAGY